MSHHSGKAKVKDILALDVGAVSMGGDVRAGGVGGAGNSQSHKIGIACQLHGRRFEVQGLLVRQEGPQGLC